MKKFKVVKNTLTIADKIKILQYKESYPTRTAEYISNLYSKNLIVRFST